MSQINVDNIKNRLGSGAPSFPNGIDVSAGVTTFTNGLNVGTGASVFSPATNVLALGTNSAERVRVGAAGSVGIGTDNPGASLDVVSNSSAEIARLRGRSADNIGTLYFQNNAGSTNYAYIQSRPTYLDIATETTNPIIFTTNQSERMRLLSGGGLTFNGDTAAANALDDYEEGTFANPEIVPQTGSFSSVTYDGDTAARYIKIGNIVHYWGTVRWTAFSIGTGSGTLRVTTPFQVAARVNGDDSDNVGATIVPVWGGTSTTHPTTIQAQNGQSRCIFRATRHDATSVTLLVGDVGSTGMIAFSITYQTP